MLIHCLNYATNETWCGLLPGASARAPVGSWTQTTCRACCEAGEQAHPPMNGTVTGATVALRRLPPPDLRPETVDAWLDT